MNRIYHSIERDKPSAFKFQGADQFYTPGNTVKVPNTDTVRMKVKDQKTGKEEMKTVQVRYLPGYEDTIILAEQIAKGAKGEGKDGHVYQPTDYIWMENGAVSVDPEQKPGLALFMEVTNRNADNPNRFTQHEPIFKRYDQEAIVQKEYEARNRIKKAQAIVDRVEKDDVLRRHLLDTFGIDRNSSLARIIVELDDRAKSNPEMVIAAAGETQMDLAALVSDAFALDVLRLEPTGIRWASGDEFSKTKAGSLTDAKEALFKELSAGGQTERIDKLKRQVVAVQAKSNS